MMFGAQDSALILAASVMLGLFATGLSASLSYVFTKRRQREVDERRLRREYYLRFISATSSLVVSRGASKALAAWSQAFNELQVVAVPPVLKAVQDFGEHTDPVNADLSSPEWNDEYFSLLSRVLVAMRRDLFGKERGLDDALATMVFRRPGSPEAGSGRNGASDAEQAHR